MTQYVYIENVTDKTFEPLWRENEGDTWLNFYKLDGVTLLAFNLAEQAQDYIDAAESRGKRVQVHLSNNVREVNKAVKAHASGGRVTVWLLAGSMKFRVYKARIQKGKFQVKILNNGWIDCETARIETL